MLPLIYFKAIKHPLALKPWKALSGRSVILITALTAVLVSISMHGAIPKTKKKKKTKKNSRLSVRLIFTLCILSVRKLIVSIKSKRIISSDKS